MNRCRASEQVQYKVRFSSRRLELPSYSIVIIICFATPTKDLIGVHIIILSYKQYTLNSIDFDRSSY